jgi:hypothetical protein
VTGDIAVDGSRDQPKKFELFAPGHHVWVGENVTARTPIFCVVLKDGEYWEVEAEWPDGTIEPVYKFKAGLEALNWVKTQSAAWVDVLLDAPRA